MKITRKNLKVSIESYLKESTTSKSHDKIKNDYANLARAFVLQNYQYGTEKNTVSAGLRNKEFNDENMNLKLIEQTEMVIRDYFDKNKNEIDDLESVIIPNFEAKEDMRIPNPSYNQYNLMIFEDYPEVFDELEAIAKEVDKSYYNEIKNSQATQKKKPIVTNHKHKQSKYACTAKGAIYDADGIADYSLDTDVLRVRSKSGEEIAFSPSDLPVDFEEISIYEILPSEDAIMSGLKAEYIDGSKPDFELPMI